MAKALENQGFILQIERADGFPSGEGVIGWNDANAFGAHQNFHVNPGMGNRQPRHTDIELTHVLGHNGQTVDAAERPLDLGVDHLALTVLLI